MKAITQARARDAILEILARFVGSKRRIDKSSLLAHVSQMAGVNIKDRELRKMIEDLRSKHPEGARICSSLQGGYFMARDLDELEKHIRSDENRIKTIYHRLKAQRKNAGIELTGQEQLKLFDLYEEGSPEYKKLIR